MKAGKTRIERQKIQGAVDHKIVKTKKRSMGRGK